MPILRVILLSKKLAASVNFLDPVRWPDISVNPKGPLGDAFVNTDAESDCFSVTLSDPRRFRESLDCFGNNLGGCLVPLYQDRGVVLGCEDERGSTLVLRNTYAEVERRGNVGMGSIGLNLSFVFFHP